VTGFLVERILTFGLLVDSPVRWMVGGAGSTFPGHSAHRAPVNSKFRQTCFQGSVGVIGSLNSLSILCGKCCEQAKISHAPATLSHSVTALRT